MSQQFLTSQNQLKSTVTSVIWFEHFCNSDKNVIKVVYRRFSAVWTLSLYAKGMFKRSLVCVHLSCRNMHFLNYRI